METKSFNFRKTPLFTICYLLFTISGMEKFVLLDTETTGNEKKDYLCQLAYGTKSEMLHPLNPEHVINELYKPPVPISIDSMVVHHITEAMVTDKMAFKFSNEHGDLKKLFEEGAIMVAHNATFDADMIKKEGVIPDRIICTLRLARFLDDECKIAKYNLQYLRYFLGIEIGGKAHDACGDVLVMDQLFMRLATKFLERHGGNETKAIEEMVEISSRPSLIHIIPFGKYLGSKVADLAKDDRGYLEWLLIQKETSETNDEDWIYTLRHHLGKLQ